MKYLKDMHERKEIEGRASGTQSSYSIHSQAHSFAQANRSCTTSSRSVISVHLPLNIRSAAQDPNLQPSPEDLAELTTRTSTLFAETNNLNTTAKTLRAHLNALTSAPSTTDLLASVRSLQAEKAALETRLAPLRTGSLRPMDEKERGAMEVDIARWRKVEQARRKIAREVWGVVKEGCETREDIERLKEEFGVAGM